MVIAALFKIARGAYNPNVYNQYVVYPRHGKYLAIRGNGGLMPAAVWMNLENRTSKRKQP